MSRYSPVRHARPHNAVLPSVLARVRNPLHGIPQEKLLANVEAFAEEQGMKDILGVLQKGALLAQNPGHPESIKELDENDLEVIRREKTREFGSFSI